MQKDSLLLASALFLAASASAQSLDSLSSSLATTSPLYKISRIGRSIIIHRR
jgi:hypothetical protein